MNENPFRAPVNEDAAAKPQQKPKGNIQGLGGWLAVFGFTLIISLVVRAFSITNNLKAMNSDGWNRLVTPGSGIYDPMWQPSIYIEIFLLSAFSVLNLIVIYLYFTKRRALVKAFFILAIGNVLFAVLDMGLCYSIHNYPADQRDGLVKIIVQASVYAGIWCSYLKKSVRVQNTFIH